MIDRNTFIAIALSLLVLTLWSYTQGGAPPAVPPTETTAPASPGVTPEGIRGDTTPALPSPPPPPSPRLAESESAPTPEEPEQTIQIENDLYLATLSSHGGTLQRWELAGFFEGKGPNRSPVVLTTAEPGDPAALSTPFTELRLGDWSEASFEVTRPTPENVVFTRTRQGVTIRKSYLLDPSNFLLTLRVHVTNASANTIEPKFQVMWPARASTHQDFTDYALVAFQEGSLHKHLVSAAGQAGFFGSLFSKGPVQDPAFQGNVEWAGAESRYFLASMIPDLARDASAQFATIEPGKVAKTALDFETVSVPPGQSVEREIRVYIGPKEQARLEAVGANLDHSIDLGYSWMVPLTKLFLWLLRALYALIPNYGIAIILLTILVRIVTAPLTSRQMNSMKRMQELQPRIKAMQEKFADDKSRQSEEMMKLYRESGVNPLGGCLPILLQFPVFVGLYYALQSSFELRQAPFFGWIDDLSAPETLFTIPGIDLPVRVLPLVMGASMVLQQKLSPQPTMDPAQARMMMTVMPIMFTVLFYQFPSGLVLYWLVSNLLASAHQYWLTRPSSPPPAVETAVPATRERSKR